MVEHYRAHTRPDVPVFDCLLQHGVDAVPLCSYLSVVAWRMYCSTGGTSRVHDPYELAQLPHFWIECCQVIQSEQAVLERYGHKD
jgi:hypothetical protein